MRTDPVDPRDTRWEQSRPAFRVHFWARPPARAGVDVSDVMRHSEEWRLAGAADVHEVLDWARGPAGQGRRFELFAEVEGADGPGLVRLAGTGPADSGSEQRPPISAVRVTDDDAGTAAVVERERLLLRPDVRADRHRVELLLHPDFQEFGASGGIWDRAAIVDALAADPTPSGVAGGFAPVRLADGVVLLTYRVGGEPGSLRSSLWVRDSAVGWRLRFHQGTRVVRDAPA